ncbi:hypothetical protein ES705_28290 [subsurface metagenome]
MVFSGLIFPDFDFVGRKLQDLCDQHSILELITFCSAPMENGWGYLLAWSIESSKICIDYLDSLKTAIYEKGKCEDFLFRLATICENHAFSSKWWESIDEKSKSEIQERMSNDVDPFTDISSTYLMNGLESISGWKFENVITNLNV